MEDTQDSQPEEQDSQPAASALSATAMRSIKDILNTTTPNPSDRSSKISWSSHSQSQHDTIEIVEEASRRTVKTWKSRSAKQPSGYRKSDSDASNTVVSIGTKVANISLLSSTVAHATLERCLLGLNPNDKLVSHYSTVSITSDPTIVDYAKQCKPGHVIDVLELRRLSSRGIPDEPPETRRSSYNDSPDSSPNSSSHGRNTSNNIQSSAGNPHRSYRPLVWRVLLGYLPPQTELWNEVLERDRKLYNNFVEEMFSSTCPAPHDVYDAEALQKRRTEEDEHARTTEFLRGQSVFRADANADDAPSTPKPDEGNTSQETPKPLTPGLLSARMQQEWIRGEESIFNTPSGRSIGDDSGRISPLCAMNTPRTRSRKGLVIERKISEEKDGSLEQDNVPAENENGVEGMMNNLLLPNDDEDDSKKEMTRSISITTSEKDGVELSRQPSTEQQSPIPLSPSQDLDEEENILLLDEIRKDVIRTHPDLRFFLEPKEDLGQKRYAALERILFVWAKLNKGVSIVNALLCVGSLLFGLFIDQCVNYLCRLTVRYKGSICSGHE